MFVPSLSSLLFIQNYLCWILIDTLLAKVVMKSVQRNGLLIAATLLTFVLIAALWQPMSAWFASPAPQPHYKLRIAINDNYAGAGLLYLAKANGYFPQQGLDVTFLPYASGSDALASVMKQRADLATCADIPVMFASLENEPVAIVATIFTASRANGIVARRDRSIAGISDLKNKNVGVTLKTDSHYVLSTMLARHQATLNDVHVVNLGPNDMLSALQKGEIDAISTWEPGLSTVAKALGSNAIVFRTEGRFLFDFNLVGDATWIDAHPDQTERLLRALLLAKHYADSHPQQARAIIVAAMKMDAAIFDTVGPNYHFVLELNQNLLSMLEDQARWAIQNRLTLQTAMPNFLQTIKMEPLMAINPDAVTIVR
jgi:NitT/TauT family transport system substrate-binding protein